jgi:hypothetical protein
MTTKPTNADRAAYLTERIATYFDTLDTASNIIAILIDARHWCDTHGVNYGEMDRCAYGRYLIEYIEATRRRWL